jgi:hypothetical protein
MQQLAGAGRSIAGQARHPPMHPGRWLVPSLESRITAGRRGTRGRRGGRTAVGDSIDPPSCCSCSPCDATSAGFFQTKENRGSLSPPQGRKDACLRTKGSSSSSESDPIPCHDTHHVRILSEATVTSPPAARHVARAGDAGDRRRESERTPRAPSQATASASAVTDTRGAVRCTKRRHRRG